MKKLKKSLATFTVKSSIALMVLLATLMLSIQGCKKADVNTNAATIEEAKVFYEANLRLFVTNNDKGFKNLTKATLLWQNAKVTVSNDKKEVVTIPLNFKENYSLAMNDGEKQNANDAFSLQMTKHDNGKFIIEELIILKSAINGKGEMVLSINLLTGKENAFEKLGATNKQLGLTNATGAANTETIIATNPTLQGDCVLWGCYLITTQSDGHMTATLLYTYWVCTGGDGGGSGGGGNGGNNNGNDDDCSQAIQDFNNEVHSLTSISQTISTTFDSPTEVIENGRPVKYQAAYLTWNCLTGRSIVVTSNEKAVKYRYVNTPLSTVVDDSWHWKYMYHLSHNQTLTNTTYTYSILNFIMTPTISGEDKQITANVSFSLKITPPVCTTCSLEPAYFDITKNSPTLNAD